MVGYAIYDCDFCHRPRLVMYEFDLCLARCVNCGHVWISGDFIDELAEDMELLQMRWRTRDERDSEEDSPRD